MTRCIPDSDPLSATPDAPRLCFGLTARASTFPPRSLDFSLPLDVDVCRSVTFSFLPPKPMG